MRLLQFFIQAIVNLYSFSANPNLFGSKKLDNVAKLARDRAAGTQMDIESLQSMNPFETAAAKSAMTKASRTSRQMQTRMLNTMGGNASPEALIAAQGALNEGIGAAAGGIAVGAEANKNAQIMQLRGMKEQQMGEYGQQKNNAVNAANKAVDLVGQIAQGAGAALSDERVKENIEYVGELQGHKIHKYNFKGSPEVHIGVIAQEVEKKNPDKVVEQGGLKKVDYSSLFKSISRFSKK